MDEPGFELRRARAAVVGLGLMGGSLALAARAACAELAGYDADPRVTAEAVARGVVARAATAEELTTFDLLILAAPVRAILAQLERLASEPLGPRVVVLDLGSTKAEIVAAMAGLPARFDPIGGHPLCGREVSGLAQADPDLYRGRRFVLTPLPRTSPAAVRLAQELTAALGAQPMLMDPARHDALLAVSSHLPYLAAAALVRAAEAVGDEQLWQVAASGFRDTSRLAASNVTMMTDILLTNRPAVLQALAHLQIELASLQASLAQADADQLRAKLEPARARRAELFQ